MKQNNALNAMFNLSQKIYLIDRTNQSVTDIDV